MKAYRMYTNLWLFNGSLFLFDAIGHGIAGKGFLFVLGYTSASLLSFYIAAIFARTPNLRA